MEAAKIEVIYDKEKITQSFNKNFLCIAVLIVVGVFTKSHKHTHNLGEMAWIFFIALTGIYKVLRHIFLEPTLQNLIKYTIDNTGITILGRSRNLIISWNEIQDITLGKLVTSEKSPLSVIIVFKDPEGFLKEQKDGYILKYNRSCIKKYGKMILYTGGTNFSNEQLYSAIKSFCKV